MEYLYSMAIEVADVGLQGSPMQRQGLLQGAGDLQFCLEWT